MEDPGQIQEGLWGRKMNTWLEYTLLPLHRWWEQGDALFPAGWDDFKGRNSDKRISSGGPVLIPSDELI